MAARHGDRRGRCGRSDRGERGWDVRLVRQLWYILGPRERIEGSILLCGMALGALFEAVSIGLVVPFIAVLKEPGLVLDAPVAQPVLSALNLRDPEMLLI